MTEQGEQGARGERGPTGDTGEQGATGPQGPTGVLGPFGPLGERGRTGDHGQPGAAGAAGVAGAVGEQGLPGEQGIPGKSPRNWGRSLLAAFVFVVVVALVGALAIQRLDSANERLEIANERDACFAMVLTDLVQSLDESADLTAQTSAALRDYVNAAVDGKVALADTFTLVVDPATTDEEAIAAIENAATVIRHAGEVGADFDALSTELAQIRREHPTPTAADIDACR